MRKSNKSRIWQKIIFAMGILYVGAAPILFFTIATAKEPAIFMLVSGILLAVLSRFEDVSELGLFGLKAKIERALTETYVTLEQVKELAKILAVSSLSNTARSGWWGGISNEQKQEILKSTQKTLWRLGCSEQEIDDISKDFHDCQLTEYRQALLGGGASQIPKNNDQECQREWQALRERAESPPVTPDELMGFFEKYNFMTDENRKRLEGYDYYYKRKEFQDFDDFKNRRKWPSLTALNYEEKRKNRA